MKFQNKILNRFQTLPYGYTRSHQQITFGLAYSSLLNMSNSESDWNFGAGLSVEWNLYDNLTLTSGINIAQNQLEYRNDQRIAAIDAEKYDDVVLEIDLLSLEIPISLQYSMTDRFYFSVGVASASFLKENFNFTYSYEDMIQRIQYVEGEGFIEVMELVTISESVRETEPSLSSFHPAAFYNFSIGYKFDYSERSRFSLEPFVKIPTRTLSSQKISYITAGLHLKISF